MRDRITAVTKVRVQNRQAQAWGAYVCMYMDLTQGKQSAAQIYNAGGLYIPLRL